MTGHLGSKNRRGTETIKWISAIPQVTGRQGRCDVITGPASSVTGIARKVSSYEHCFDLFFDNPMSKWQPTELVTTMFNRRINKRIETLRVYREFIFNTFKYTWLKEISKEKVKALIGLIYLRGLSRINHHDIKTIVFCWSWSNSVAIEKSSCSWHFLNTQQKLLKVCYTIWVSRNWRNTLADKIFNYF